MARYVVLLRGINVGGHGRLPMKSLVPALQGDGVEVIGTHLQSGNLVVESRTSPAARIEALIERDFGFRPATLAIRCTDFRKQAAASPYVDDDGKRIHLWFCLSTPSPDRDRLEGYRDSSEAYTVIGKVFYLHAPNGIGRSKLATRVEACLGVPATARNLNTVNALLALCDH